MQNALIPVFHHALRTGGGYLFLGISENVSGFGDLFVPVEKNRRIFRVREDVPLPARLPTFWKGSEPARGGAAARAGPGAASSLLAAVEKQLLQAHVPAHVVVNRDGDVIHFSARTGRYLEPSAGTPSRNLFTMARLGLRHDLRGVFREAVEAGIRGVRRGVPVAGDDGRITPVSLTVEPLMGRGEGEPLFVVLFADDGPSMSPEEAIVQSASSHDDAVHHERELSEARERLQTLVEEYETGLEELKSTNEELVSVNEEMQSTNEELESSKEEMQSLNEELNTVNAELNDKVADLDRARNDLEHLFDSAEVATIFLDRELIIRSFTPSITRILHLRPGDKGRPITDLASRFPLPDLGREVAEVAASGTMRERSIENLDQSTHYLMRLAPYVSLNQGVDGVVITFVDVTLMRREARQSVLIAELQHRSRNLMAVVDAIARGMIKRAPSLEAFRVEFSGCLAALSRVQGLLYRADDAPVTVEVLVRAELDALGPVAVDGRVTLEGPALALRPGVVQPFALVVHELSTNALKYGALSREGGRLRVTWSERAGADAAGRSLRLDWQESGVPSQRAGESGPSSGFGRTLIERSLRHELRGEVEFVLGEDGLRCSLLVPNAIRGDAPPG